MVSLSDAVAGYQSAIENLPAEGQPGGPAQVVVAALVARDTVARAIAVDQTGADSLLHQVSELDQRLKASALRIKSLVGVATLANWREAVQPQASAWWWSLDALAPDPRPSAVWSILAALFITISISLTAEISQRFLSVGADFVSVFSTVSQAALTLLAGSTFTAVGQQAIERILNNLHIAPRRHAYWKVGFAGGLLLAVLVLRFSLPVIARMYNDAGMYWQNKERQLNSAIDSYRRAVSLYPDYAEAHYNLAVAYEEVEQYDKAIAEYQTVILQDAASYIAQNNLARLYMLRRSDFASALALLNEAIARKPADPGVQYTLYKNRGWANLGLGYPLLAGDDLNEALAIRKDGAAAYCLMGQTLEKTGDRKAALDAYENCVAYAANDPYALEPSWLNLARERLAEGGTP